MGLLTWNMGGGDKRSAIAHMGADLCVMQEIKRFPSTREADWFGSPGKKGTAVLARRPYTIARMKMAPGLAGFVIPYRVGGPLRFQLLTVWAKSPTRYVEGIVASIHLLGSAFFRKPTVAIGDFNSNTIWDSEHPTDRCHSALVRLLASHGLVSAYHLATGEAHGQESRATFHLYRHEHRPFHIDYCFVPSAWSSRVRSVTIGEHSEWSRSSDHLPMVVDLEDD